MRAGNLRQRVTLQRPALADLGSGETGVTWQDVREVWAEVKPLKGWQVERARQAQVNTTHTVRIRYAPDVTAEVLRGLGLGGIRPESVQMMDSVEFVADIQRVG